MTIISVSTCLTMPNQTWQVHFNTGPTRPDPYGPRGAATWSRHLVHTGSGSLRGMSQKCSPATTAGLKSELAKECEEQGIREDMIKLTPKENDSQSNIT